MIDQQGDQNQNGCYGETGGINEHQCTEGRILGKYRIYPADSGSAYTNGGQNCRDKGNSEAAEITGHYFVKHTEAVRNKDNNQTLVTQCDNLWVSVKKR